MMASKKIWGLLLLLLITAPGWYAFQQVKRGSSAYLFGYPLVLMDMTRGSMLRSDSDANQFRHHQLFPDHTFRNVVRPNNDTLYSIAWLDLREQPLVLSAPDTQGRYYVMPLMDAWSNVFATLGKRLNGTGAAHYTITGPDWTGEVPEGTLQVASPTNMVWMIGRIQTNGRSDIPAVAALQAQFTLTPLNRWSVRQANPVLAQAQSDTQSKQDPYDVIAQMTAVEFFSRLAALMATQPAAAADGPAIENLAELGIVPGQPFDTEQLNGLDQFLLNQALKLTRAGIKRKLEGDRPLENSWLVQRDTIGSYGTNYPVRAAVASFGLGALPPAEAAYPNTTLDSAGRPLNGEHGYRLHFEKGETPPGKAFWSLTLYDETGFLVDNPLQRYTLGDRDSLTYNADGSLDILVQHTAPAANTTNWLPAPKGKFALTMRIYAPQQRFLDGSWTLPSVERVN